MATVRFSDSLKSSIIDNARELFMRRIEAAEAQVPAHWADKIADSFFPADVMAKMNALPDYCFDTKESMEFHGFHNHDDSYFQTAEYRTHAYKLNKAVKLKFSAPRRWPYRTDDSITGFKFSWGGGTADFNDERWAWLKEEVKEYTQRIFNIKAEEAKFIEGVKRIMDTYTTLAPAIKAWQPLWDLIPQDAKDRHLRVAERKRTSADDLDVDLNTMTAAITLSKLTR